MSDAPTIVLTPGEPAGIGPDLAVMTPWRTMDCRVVVAADRNLLEQRAAARHIVLDWPDYDPENPGPISVLHQPAPEAVVPGKLDSRNASYVLHTLDTAVGGCLRREFAALVTGPVHKGIISEAGFSFSGHTEYLAGLTDTPMPVMMLAAGDLRVPLVTTHLPLREVADWIDFERVKAVVEITHRELKERFGIAEPRLAVCGLNPHAGEGGHIGAEDIEVIQPVVDELAGGGMNINGPLPADTVFTESVSAGFDAIIAMYHDQGLPVLKRVGFGHAVNITLGLPIIRVSVDHGTALDKAAKPDVDTGSLAAAFECAVRLARQGA